jgi:GDPmannose 4,6-dehydratase
MARKKALITGISGQDGSYLAEALLELGYEVHGVVRRVALEDPEQRLFRLSGVLDRIHLHPGSLEGFARIFRVVEEVKPDECYHLAALSFVSYEFEDELSAIHANIDATQYLLEAVRELAPRCRVYFAASSEVFGSPSESPQSETTPFRPRSPYGIAKLVGYHLTRNYRESHGLYACSGILYNHESERRGFEFITRKVTNAAARIRLGLQGELRVGNLDARRDWGYAPDYVRAMWSMLQQDRPEDFVVATGVTHSVRELIEIAFNEAGVEPTGHVTVDQNLFRPAEELELRGDSRKARQVLGWAPSTSFPEMVRRMVAADLARWSAATPSAHARGPE